MVCAAAVAVLSQCMCFIIYCLCMCVTHAHARCMHDVHGTLRGSRAKGYSFQEESLVTRRAEDVACRHLHAAAIAVLHFL